MADSCILRHPHNLISHRIRFLLINVIRLTDFEFGLNYFTAARTAAAAWAEGLALDRSIAWYAKGKRIGVSKRRLC